jgi:hypothetical protein
MKKSAIVLLFSFLTCFNSAQEVNGVIVMSTPNLNVIKVWGTAQERAYAYGYLLGHGSAQVFNGYIKPIFIGNNYQAMRDIIIEGEDISIDSVYIYEAMSFIEGYRAASGNPDSLDYVDVLIGNSIESLIRLVNADNPAQCSSLMSWGEATAGTDLDGKSVISHHLDLPLSNVSLINNHVIVVNFPSEPYTQEWLLAHFAGSLVPIDGFNRYFGVFGQSMDDYNEAVYHGQGYLPHGYALRKALEASDYNSDQYYNIQDVKAALDDCTNGFAAAGITAGLAATQPFDSLTALICEFASNEPTHVYRYNSYPDSIPGDNLYTANYQIARNNAMHFCYRYNNIRDHIEDGTMIGLDENWELTKNYSNLSTNVQLKQYAPEADHFQIAIRTESGIPAYQNTPYVFSINDLFGGVPLASAGSDTAICENADYVLSGGGLACYFIWSSTGDGTFSDTTIMNPLYTPGAGDIEDGSVLLILTAYLNSEKYMADTLSLDILPLPDTPQIPSGPETVDLYYTQTSDYTIPSTSYADVYIWELQPGEAGIITGTSEMAVVTWNETFSGIAIIQVKGMNDCGEGAFSESLEVNVYNSVGIDQSAVGSRRSAVCSYPNPFNSSVLIEYELEEKAAITLVIFNQFGQQVEILMNDVQTEGNHLVQWDSGNSPAGVYYYQIKAEKRIMSGKVIKML